MDDVRGRARVIRAKRAVWLPSRLLRRPVGWLVCLAGLGWAAGCLAAWLVGLADSTGWLVGRGPWLELLAVTLSPPYSR